MLDVRDLTDHPAVPSRVSAPQAAAALSGLGFLPLGYVEVPNTEPHSLRQLLVATDGQTVALLWTPQDHELVTLMSVLEDGTILETEILPGPKLLRTFFKPGYPGLGLRTAHGPAQVAETVQQHRGMVQARAEGLSSPPVLLRERRRVLATLERKAQIEVASLMGSVAGILATVVLGALHLYWLRGLMLEDTVAETLQALAPGVPVVLALVAPFLILVVIGMTWPVLFTRVPIGGRPTASELFAGSDAPPTYPGPPEAGPAEPNRARWRGSALLAGVRLPFPPVFVLALLLAPLVAVALEAAKPAGFAEDHARKFGTDDALLGDWTELAILLAVTVLAAVVVTLRQRLEITAAEVSFRPMLRGFTRQVRPRSAVLGVWLRGSLLKPSRWPWGWEVLVVLSADDLPLVTCVDARKDRAAAERVATELARRLDVPFEDRSRPP